MGRVVELADNIVQLSTNRIFNCLACGGRFLELPPHRKLRRYCSDACCRSARRRKIAVAAFGCEHPRLGDLVRTYCIECNSAIEYHHHNHKRFLCSRRCVNRRFLLKKKLKQNLTFGDVQ